ncbi:hypothetical protein GOODEAATRI_022931 [Goodea atripinnis]|uniref:Dynein axonemal assembly factor 4 n=1 Tax=Goodea atripinnis TaxID=208336 RepID=A0ABV0NCY2_9TELE
MPLNVTDYTWSQTDSTIHLSVPLKGATVRKVDIVSTEEYLKVHFPPFLFEAFLFEPVDDDRSTARIGNGVAVFTLPKKTCKLWERLMITTAVPANSAARVRASIRRGSAFCQLQLYAEGLLRWQKVLPTSVRSGWGLVFVGRVCCRQPPVDSSSRSLEFLHFILRF